MCCRVSSWPGLWQRWQHQRYASQCRQGGCTCTEMCWISWRGGRICQRDLGRRCEYYCCWHTCSPWQTPVTTGGRNTKLITKLSCMLVQYTLSGIGIHPESCNAISWTVVYFLKGELFIASTLFSLIVPAFPFLPSTLSLPCLSPSSSPGLQSCSSWECSQRCQSTGCAGRCKHCWTSR